MNEYGQAPLYRVGDRVRIWKVFKNPIGTVQEIVDSSTFPIKYIVKYTYWEGGDFTEEFEESELSLFDRLNMYYCNCRTHSGKHSIWCNWYD